MVSATGSSIQIALTESPYDGGAAISEYQLWMDTGYGSDFSLVATFPVFISTHTVTSGVTAGTVHTFKFKAVNAVGDSEFSALVRIAAA